MSGRPIGTIQGLVALGGYDDPAALVSHLAATGTLACPDDRAELDMSELVRDAERLTDLQTFAGEYPDHV